VGDLGGVVDVEDPRQVAVDAQQGPIGGRGRRDQVAQQGRRGDLVGHDQQGPLGQERPRHLHRQTVGFLPVGVFEEGDLALERRRDPGRFDDGPAQVVAAPPDGDRDLPHAQGIQQREGTLDQRGLSHDGEAVGAAVIADGDPLAGCQDQRASDHRRGA
jgi:hypothetical protein